MAGEDDRAEVIRPGKSRPIFMKIKFTKTSRKVSRQAPRLL
jgi:hypothetical protein